MKYIICIVMAVSSLNSFAAQKDSCDWIFIYYAPYDNNLSIYADSIINQLSTASQYENIRVVFQVDKDDTLGMYRYTIRPDGIHMDSIPSEESTSREQLTDYLDWVNASFEFKRSAVFFLDHGGGLDEVGQDVFPDSTFLKTTDIRNALHYFNETNNQLVDLIYLQVCAKSSIEPLYELHDVGAYTLACQKLLGAPNFYYEEMIKYASRFPIIRGEDVAMTASALDKTEMFESLTCIDNSKFKQVKIDFLEFVEKLEKQKALNFTRAPKRFEYGNDHYWDLIDFLNCLDINRNSEIKARDQLILSIRELTEFKYTNKENGFCGISIASLSKGRMKAFSHMRFYQDFGLSGLPIE